MNNQIKKPQSRVGFFLSLDKEMIHENIQVKSRYISQEPYEYYVEDPKNIMHSFCFQIRNFKSIVKILHLANNTNQYELILTEKETEKDVQEINEHLLLYKKNPEFDRKNLTMVCFAKEQMEWCVDSNLQSKFVEIPIMCESTQVPKKIQEPGWSFKRHTLFFNYYSDENYKIIHLEGFDSHWRLLPHITNNTYMFVTNPSYGHKWNYEVCFNALYTQNPQYDGKQVIFLSPDLDSILWSYEYGFHAILCNQNSFIDYSRFYTEKTEKKYDMVMNCRPERWKRPYLAEKVDDLAYIKGATYGATLYDYKLLRAKFVNETRLNIQGVVAVYNESCCGGIFSEKEGACYSSSEYLLCGLPVISTTSRGGRDTWYNPENSIIVEANADAVVEAVKRCKLHLLDGTFDSKKIRDYHIQMAENMRTNFNNCVQCLFDKHGIQINAQEYFKKTFRHLLKENIPLEDCIPFFS